MIRVTIELLPGGREKDAKVIAKGEIRNDLSHPDRPRRGNYQAAFWRVPNGKLHSAAVKDFPRERLHVLHLLQRALEEAMKSDGK